VTADSVTADNIKVGDRSCGATPLRMIAGAVRNYKIQSGQELLKVQPLGGEGCHGTEGRWEIKFTRRASATEANGFC
jgi:hypothetical protein